jgi:hypothetical protein
MVVNQAVENESGRTPTEKGNKRITFKYSLSYDEAYDAFLILSARGRKRTRDAVAVILMILAAALTVLYAFHPYHIEYFLLALLVLATFGGVVYYPKIKAHVGAKRVEKARGVYDVEFLAEGYIKTPDGSCLEMSGDKDARVFETETLFVLRPDRQNTFCLPKRVMSDQDISLVRSIVAENVKNFFRTDSDG